jgi:DNA-binding transcriptional MerR regulator
VNINNYKIGELAELAGVSTRTIDYYTKIGLIHEEKRTTGKHRLYTEEALIKVKLIKQLQEHHFSLDEIYKFLIPNSNNDINQLTLGIKELLDTLEGKIAELYTQMKNTQEINTEIIALKMLALQGSQIVQTLLQLSGDIVI